MRQVFNLVMIVLNCMFVADDRSSRVVCENADLTELNHYHDMKGNLIFDQAIFWRWYVEESCYHVRGWMMAEPERVSIYKNYRSGHTVVEWQDFERIKRKITSKLFRESWTMHDPERLDKQYVSEGDRVSLIRRLPTPND